MRFNIVVTTYTNDQPPHVHVRNREPLRPGKVDRAFHDAVAEEYERLLRGGGMIEGRESLTGNVVQMDATGDSYETTVYIEKAIA